MRFLMIALGLCGLAVAPVSAADWTVLPDGSGDFPTIQAAIDAAEPGDRVLLGPGVFRDVVTRQRDGEMLRAIAWLRDGVDLIGAGSDQTFLDGEEDHRGLIGIKMKPTHIGGFTLLHCDTEATGVLGQKGGGALFLESSPSLDDIRFVGCNSWNEGAGLHIERDAEAPINITNCAFIYCYSRTYGGGMHLRMLPTTFVTNNTFVGNFAEERGGAISYSRTGGDMSNNVFWYNCSHEGGGALWCHHQTPFGGCNLFWENFPEADEPTLCKIFPGRDGNVIGNPRFCDIPAEDFTIDAVSPAAPDNSGDCGLIGAYPVACGEDRHGVRDFVPIGGFVGEADGIRVRVTPNPVRAATTLEVEAPEREAVDLVTAKIVDVQGRLVRSLETNMTSGRATLNWDGRDRAGGSVAPGIYLARIACGAETCHTRIVVLR